MGMALVSLLNKPKPVESLSNKWIMDRAIQNWNNYKIMSLRIGYLLQYTNWLRSSDTLPCLAVSNELNRLLQQTKERVKQKFSL